MAVDRVSRPGAPGWVHATVMVVLLAVIVVAVATAPTTPEDRVERLAGQLRCPVCQGVSVAESRSDTALAMQDQIRHMVEAGESDADIRGYFVDRYGQWALLDPSGSGLGLALWGLPAAALLIGLAVLLARRRRPAPPVAPEWRAAVRHEVERRRQDEGGGA